MMHCHSLYSSLGVTSSTRSDDSTAMGDRCGIFLEAHSPAKKRSMQRYRSILCFVAEFSVKRAP